MNGDFRPPLLGPGDEQVRNIGAGDQQDEHDRGEQSGDRRQFERIIDAIARQLRSPLERAVGRYSVEIAIFPDR